jgi:ribosomal protein L29
MSTFADKPDGELNELLAKKREKLREIRFNITGASDTSPHEKQELKKDVARILTELRERQLTA